uniref:hypothetical protein n=1 Tax=Ferrovum myxofaciens TaxID=416213 RepID=UPI001F3EE8BA
TSRVEAGNISRKGYAAGLRRSGIPTLPVLARQPKAEGGEDVNLVDMLGMSGLCYSGQHD